MAIPLNESNARQAMEAAAHSIEPYPNTFEGRGIVIPAGGAKYFPSAYVSIRMLKELGCTLPIEVWHLGERELDQPMQTILNDLGVKCVNAHHVGSQRYFEVPGPGGGWELKSYALIHCRFKQVLLLDADNLAVTDPTALFESDAFSQTGAVFWPDYWRFKKDNPIWHLTGIPFRDEPEVESGQLLVDKQRCWNPLLLAGWMNENSRFWYRYMLGDKDTFRLGWRKLGVEYAMPARPIKTLQGTMCQHDFAGKRMFQHHNFHKWNVDAARVPVAGFLHMEKCFAFLDQLREIWVDRPTRPYHPSFAAEVEKKVAEELCRARWMFCGNGERRRGMIFNLDGTIGEGLRRTEQTWNIQHNGFSATLIIMGHEGQSCRLVQGDGQWRGRLLGREAGMASLQRKKKVDGPKALPLTSAATARTAAHIRLIIPTVPRSTPYVHTTLASFFASGPHAHRVAGVHLFAGDVDSAYLDPYLHHGRIQIHPLPASDNERMRDWSVHRKACLNHYRCLSAPSDECRGVCFCEDDIVFCDDFVQKLLQAIREIEIDQGIRRYILSCYCPYHLDEQNNGTAYVRNYPIDSFYGTQCIYYPRSIVPELAKHMHDLGVEAYRYPADLIVKEFARKTEGIFVTTRSIVQHIGRHTTGLGNFHASPTFAGAGGHPVNF